MMESMESTCIPPGIRFHPTDEELVGYYLRKKVASQRIDLDVIRDIDLYRIEPWDLQDTCRLGYENQNEWYFFSHKDKKYPTGTRSNRSTMAGFWKATGRDKAVRDKLKLIGMRKTLVFYKGRAPNGQKTDWIMHEYRLESEENEPPQEEGWVVCRAFQKRASTGQTRKSIQSWDSSYFLNEPSNFNSVLNPRDTNSFLLPQNILCEQQLNMENLHRMHSDQVVQLPQLECPSVPLVKRPDSISILFGKNEEDHDLSHQISSFSNNDKKITTDWRDLDKLVASQLSREDNQYEAYGASCSFLGDNHNDFNSALMSLHTEDDGGNKLNVFLSSTSDCDRGICVFEN